MSVDTHPGPLACPPIPDCLAAIPAFTDNYIWAVTCPAGRQALLVDPGDAAVAEAWLAARGLALAAILVTHHHMDHTGGVQALRQRWQAPAWGPRHEAIAGIDHPVGDGDRVLLPGLGVDLAVLDVPGHTAGHVAYTGRVGGREVLFCGDTLFSAGCGRLFEGSPEEMHASLARLAALPPDTLVCCAHEYTLGNLRFATAVEPANPDIAAAVARVRALRDAGQPSLPSDIARERLINPFLRTQETAVIAAAARHDGHDLAAGAPTFAALRRWKDVFR